MTPEELERARENVKGRSVLSMESTLSRMNRLGSAVLMGVPVLSVDELLAAFDAVTLEEVNAPRARAVGARAALGGRRGGGRGRLPGGSRACLARAGGVINVAVSGAAGRMGATVCRAVEGADDMALVGRADPQLGVALRDVLGDADVVVDFSTPGQRPRQRPRSASRRASTA